MRALITDPEAITAADYQGFVRQAQLDGYLADHMVAGEPYLALNAVVIERGEAELLRHLTDVFSSAFQRAGRRLASQSPTLVDWGFPWVAAELCGLDEQSPPLVGRFDFVRDTNGRWWLLEFNADTPSGIREAMVADQLAFERIGVPHGLDRPNRGLREALISTFDGALRDLPVGSALGLVTTASELEDLAQMAYTRDMLDPALSQRGVSVVLGDIDNLEATARGLRMCGRRIAALYRYVPFESMFGSVQFAALYEAVATGRLRLLNGLFGLLLQHKGLVAWLYAHRADPSLSAEERSAVRDHLPGTWWLGHQPGSVAVRDLVAKQVFGREGEEVFFGEGLPPQDWDVLQNRKTYVAQRRVQVEEFPVVVPSSTGPRLVQACATVGCYALRGRWAGFYTRVGGRIITSRAKWLATFAE